MKKTALFIGLTILASNALNAQSFQLVNDINPGSASGTPSEFVDIGQSLIFKAKNGNSTQGIFRSDGTNSGTYMISDVYASELDQTKIVRSGNIVYFTVVTNDVVSLWISYGVPGAFMIKDSLGLDQDIQMIDNNGTLFFLQHNTDTNGNTVTQLWKSDGSTLGTVVVKEWALNLNVTIDFAYNDLVYFTIVGSNAGLYVSDGTDTGTILIDNSISSMHYPKIHNGLVYFNHMYGIAKSNGTDAGTGFVTNLITAVNADFTIYNNKFYLTCSSTGNGQDVELYVSNGTQTPTLLKDINPGANSSNPSNFLLAPDGFYFYADDGVHGRELWKSDGTTAGTHMVKDIKPGTSNNVTYFDKKIMYNNRLFFMANDDVSGAELWSTDGTEANTYLHQDINDAGAGGSACLDNMTIVNNQILFFAGCNTATGNELWSSGTVGLDELSEKNSSLLIVPNPAKENIQLKSDMPISTYIIIDLNGRVIAQGNFDNSIKIDTLESGCYMIQAVLSNGTIATQRLIKQ